MVDKIHISRASFGTSLCLDDYGDAVLRPEQSRDAVRLETRVHVPAIPNHGALHPGPSADREADRERFRRYLKTC